MHVSCGLLTGLMLCVAGPGHAQSEYWFLEELAPYRALVETYREGDVDAAVAGVRAVDALVVHDLIDRIEEPDRRLSGTDPEPALNERLFRAAAMLHVDVADHLWSRGLQRGAEDHIEVALRWIGLTVRDPEPSGSFRRRWFMGVALLAFEHGGWQDGVTFTDLACDLVPDDVALLTTAAWFSEGLALAPVSAGDVRERDLSRLREQKRSRLLAAARRAGAAVRLAPAASEATLRLARVRMLLGFGESVRESLTALADRDAVPRDHAYLAKLLLGKLHEGAGELPDAERRFREAIEVHADGQVARVALAQLLGRQGDRLAAARALEPVLRGEQDHVIDPWVDYLLGTGWGPDLRALLRREVAR